MGPRLAENGPPGHRWLEYGVRAEEDGLLWRMKRNVASIILFFVLESCTLLFLPHWENMR